MSSNRVVTITVGRKARKEKLMLLRIKDIREVLEKTLSMFYADADFSVGSTKVMNKTKDFRIEFRIYDAEFWMDIDLGIDSVHIGTRSLGDVDHIDSLQMWLSKPYEYNTDKFDFSWRKDLEYFFDGLHEYLKERVERAHNPRTTEDTETKASIFSNLKDEEGKAGAAVIAAILNGLDDKANDAKAKENKTSIFNNLKDDEDEDEYI